MSLVSLDESVKTHQTVQLLKHFHSGQSFTPQQPKYRRLRRAAGIYSLGSFDVDTGSVISFIFTMKSVRKKKKALWKMPLLTDISRVLSEENF